MKTYSFILDESIEDAIVLIYVPYYRKPSSWSEFYRPIEVEMSEGREVECAV